MNRHLHRCRQCIRWNRFSGFRPLSLRTLDDSPGCRFQVSGPYRPGPFSKLSLYPGFEWRRRTGLEKMWLIIILIISFKSLSERIFVYLAVFHNQTHGSDLIGLAIGQAEHVRPDVGVAKFTTRFYYEPVRYG